MSGFFRVAETDPEMLKKTLEALPHVGKVAVNRIERSGETALLVRCSGDAVFAKFACERQGYATVLVEWKELAALAASQIELADLSESQQKALTALSKARNGVLYGCSGRQGTDNLNGTVAGHLIRKGLVEIGQDRCGLAVAYRLTERGRELIEGDSK